VGDLPAGSAHIGASNLFESPEAAIRGVLHARRDTGYSDDTTSARDDRAQD
jgi:hypothetical protein